MPGVESSITDIKGLPTTENVPRAATGPCQNIPAATGAIIGGGGNHAQGQGVSNVGGGTCGHGHAVDVGGRGVGHGQVVDQAAARAVGIGGGAHGGGTGNGGGAHGCGCDIGEGKGGFVGGGAHGYVTGMSGGDAAIAELAAAGWSWVQGPPGRTLMQGPNGDLTDVTALKGQGGKGGKSSTVATTTTSWVDVGAVDGRAVPVMATAAAPTTPPGAFVARPTPPAFAPPPHLRMQPPPQAAGWPKSGTAPHVVAKAPFLGGPPPTWSHIMAGPLGYDPYNR